MAIPVTQCRVEEAIQVIVARYDLTKLGKGLMPGVPELAGLGHPAGLTVTALRTFRWVDSFRR